MEGAGLGSGGVGIVTSAVGGVVVVLERSAAQGKAPGRGPEAGAARDGEGAAVDEAPGVFGFVEGLGVGGDGNDAEPGVLAAVGLEGDDEGVSPWFCWAISEPKSQRRTWKVPPGTLRVTQRSIHSRSRRRLLVDLSGPKVRWT